VSPSASHLLHLLTSAVGPFRHLPPDRSHHFGAIFDQPLGAHGEDIQLRAADDETKVLE
jgi:hypothetical protein